MKFQTTNLNDTIVIVVDIEGAKEIETALAYSKSKFLQALRLRVRDTLTLITNHGLNPNK